MTDKDFSMKPTANDHKSLKFSLRKIVLKKSQSTFELFKLEKWSQSKKIRWFLRDPGPE